MGQAPAHRQGEACTLMPDQNPSPRFAYLELSTLFGRDGDEELTRYFSRLGFHARETHTPVGPHPAWRSMDMRRGSARIMVTGHRSGSGFYPRVLHSGPYFSAVAFATRDLVFTLNCAQDAGLNVTGRIEYRRDGSAQSNVEGPGGMTYTFIQGAGWGADDRQPGTGSLDHIAVVTTNHDHRRVIDAHRVLFGADSWHPMPLTRLPSGEAMGSGFIHAGDVRITIVWAEGECRQLTGFRAIGGDGIQHAALRVDDTDGGILAEVDKARGNGIRFRDAPDAYYDYLEKRLDHPIPDLDDLKARGILADDDEFTRPEDGPHGIRQIFAAPFGVSERGPFIELIDRSLGGQTFGGRNILALAESVELTALRAASRA